jgi:O6-methylguanine-DNA--protein-cysteine methyltransferase
MNLIQRQADDFIQLEMDEYGNYKEFISKVNSHLLDYKKTSHRIEFTERVITKVKITYDEHLISCKNKEDCSINKFCENTLFFLQEEIGELEEQLTPNEFTKTEKININSTLQIILEDLNKIKFGQQITYDDIAIQFDELKDLYFLDKKNWKQLFAGKLTEMIAGGIISETVSKEITNSILKNYQNLILNS